MVEVFVLYTFFSYIVPMAELKLARSMENPQNRLSDLRKSARQDVKVVYLDIADEMRIPEKHEVNLILKDITKLSREELQERFD